MKNLPEDTWLMGELWSRIPGLTPGPLLLIENNLRKNQFPHPGLSFLTLNTTEQKVCKTPKVYSAGGIGGWGSYCWMCGRRGGSHLASSNVYRTCAREKAIQRARGQEDSGASPGSALSCSMVAAGCYLCLPCCSVPWPVNIHLFTRYSKLSRHRAESPPLSSYKLASMKVTFAQEETQPPASRTSQDRVWVSSKEKGNRRQITLLITGAPGHCLLVNPGSPSKALHPSTPQTGDLKHQSLLLPSGTGFNECVFVGLICLLSLPRAARSQKLRFWQFLG